LQNAFFYSRDGLQAAYRYEAAFRLEAYLAVLLLPAALLLRGDGLGRALLIGSVFLVLIAELLNSAIESVVDRISLDSHNLSKRAKDIGSAAVFLALINAFLIWVSLLLESP
jgi:diacylglycerol kinase (ATP)